MSFTNGVGTSAAAGLLGVEDALHHHHLTTGNNNNPGNGNPVGAAPAASSCTNWPFSVRYTASPYRKSKYHQPPSPEPTMLSSMSMPPPQAPPSHPPHFHAPHSINNNPAGGPIQGVGGPPFIPPHASSSNGSLGRMSTSSKFNGDPQDHLLLLQNPPGGFNPLSYQNHFVALKQHQMQQQQLLHQRQRQHDHYHYGLPVTALPPGVILHNHHHPSSVTGISGKDAHHHQPPMNPIPHRMKYSGSFERKKLQQHLLQMNNPSRNFNQVLDEGYIEDLKTSYPPQQHQQHSLNGHQQPRRNNFQTSHLVSPERPHPPFPSNPPPGESAGAENYNPYNYVYDSHLVQIKEDLSVCSASVNQAFLTSNASAYHSLPPVPSSSLPHKETEQDSESENEYEEIRDVQRYINMSNYGLTPGGSAFRQVLSETLDVPGGCDSISSSLASTPLAPKHFKSFSTSTDDILAEVVRVKQKHDRVLDQLNLEVENLLIKSSSEVEIGHNLETMGSCEVDNNVNNNLKEMKVSLAFHPGGHGETASLGGTFGRKKKLDRRAISLLCTPGQCKCHPGGSSGECRLLGKGGGDVNLKKVLGGFVDSENDTHPHNVHHHNHLNCESAKAVLGQQGSNGKKFGQRSYSLIPNWKIRDHLMRLPFLRHHHDKLKKGEGRRGSCTIPTSGPSLDKQGNNKLGKGMIATAGATARENNSPSLLKNRASSMDELRSTGEEHWYSADSDTDPESLGGTNRPADAPPQEDPKTEDQLAPLGNTNSTSSSSVNGSSAPPTSAPHQPPNLRNGNLYSNSDHNGSKMDIGSVIPDVPKAPKFRSGGRGSGLKDRWRESWSAHSKTLLKSTSMEEENRLSRWFSLRKNSVTMDPSSKSNRHSTLPQLSEEDLKRISFMEDEEGYWPRRQVQPPTLPPPPPDLSPEQTTRRHIIAAIVHSENNYVAALQRLVNEYKKPLECSHPAILSHSKISAVFHRVPEILQCHSLFRIALAECVRRWDAEEKIGDVFVASFSKSLVLDVYSEFINNFGHAMGTAKVETRRKSTFGDFLKVKQMTSHDRLSLFGLMVKPVQRFPQFILLLQDLLKHTPKDHHDRMSLQLALTQLESLAAMLNERKRESEQYQAFRETIKSIGGGKFVLLRSIVDDPNRILLRQDVVTQLEFDNNGGTVSKSKSRRLLLLNDMLICTTQSGSSFTEGGGTLSRTNSVDDDSASKSKSEKSVFKWSYPVRDVEVEDISISPTMSRFVQGRGGTGGGKPFAPQTEESASITLLEEMQSLMHDYEVLSRILALVSTLKTTYDGLSVSTVKELMLEIQHQIRCRDEQISYFDSSCLTLLLGNNKEKVVFQMRSPEARSAWIEELRLAQLALDPANSPAWDIPPESPYPHHKLPLFVRALPLSKQPHLTTVKCGCFFTHTFVSQTGRSKILDYLWVSSTDGMSSHLTAYRSQQNTLKETSSFDLVEEKVNDMLFVYGFIWVATESRKIMVFDPADQDKGQLSHQILSASVLKLILYNKTIYAGLSDGNVAIFSPNIAIPEIPYPELVLQIGSERIAAMFVSREHVYAACGNSIVTIDTRTHAIDKSVTLNHHSGPISHMTCSGVGLWITTHESGTVCLYHLESFQHLQDVSIAPSVYRTVRDAFRRSKGVHVTSLIAHKGWLWIGTNLGVILTIPLPRLEGVPIISTGNANVSFHGFCGPVTFLMPLSKTPALPAPTSSKKQEVLPTESAQPEASKSESTDCVKRNASSVSFADCVDKSSDIIRSNSLNKNSGDDVPNSEKSMSPLKDLLPPLLTSTPLTNGAPHEKTSSSSSIENASSPSPSQGSKTLVVLRKKSSKDSVILRNCKTLPRGGPNPANLRFSIDSDVYGLYGNLINVRGLEEEGRFVDPLYDALRRSDPELNALDAKISTLDRRLKMRMSRPRSLDLSNWSVDSKISASSDESSVGLGSLRAGGNGGGQHGGTVGNTPPPPLSEETDNHGGHHGETREEKTGGGTTSRKGTTKHHHAKSQKPKGPVERTVLVVVGGRGYLNMKAMAQEHFISTMDSETKSSPHLTLWQMKT